MPELDSELRRLASAIATSAPPVPDLEELAIVDWEPDLHPPRRRRLAVAFAALGLVIAAGVIALSGGGSSHQESLGSSPSFVPCATPDPGPFVGPNGKTFGPLPRGTPEGGMVEAQGLEAIPDYVTLSCDDGTNVAGYVARNDMFNAASNGGLIAVYADDGRTVVGHFGNGKGFIPLASDAHRVQGTLLLTRDEHWRTQGSGRCVGHGLYENVGPTTRVVVQNERGMVLARTTLRAGKSGADGCRMGFTVTLPAATTYTFKVGQAGSVFQESYDDSGLALAIKHNRVTFEV